ncbi:MAG TPA: NAD(P)H-hydrate epimerase [Candidatus Limnocylindrales bacterium]|jgi:NAD(P)H-hydrate epimerase
MSTRAAVIDDDPAPTNDPLPGDDPGLLRLSLGELRRRWSATAERAPIGAEAMAGADHRAQALGIPGERLMEHAGTAVAAAVAALLRDQGRVAAGSVLLLCGPGNNGGDGFVAARRLADAGIPSIAVLVSPQGRPATPDSGRNWDRLADRPNVTRLHAAVARDVAILAQGAEKAAVVVDALLGTGVRGALREPVRSAVELILRVRALGVPIVAVDTPTAVDLTSGDASQPAAVADLTVTFHRPKTGLRTRIGRAHAGKVLVAPIGIPPEADRG